MNFWRLWRVRYFNVIIQNTRYVWGTLKFLQYMLAKSAVRCKIWYFLKEPETGHSSHQYFGRIIFRTFFTVGINWILWPIKYGRPLVYTASQRVNLEHEGTFQSFLSRINTLYFNPCNLYLHVHCIFSQVCSTVWFWRANPGVCRWPRNSCLSIWRKRATPPMP